MRAGVLGLFSCLLGVVACSWDLGGGSCFLCGRPLNPQTIYEIESTEGQIHQVCCARCGVHYQAYQDQVAGARVADYHSTEMIDSEEAFFVEASSVMPCSPHDAQRDSEGTSYSVTWDRCAPSLIAFASGEEARRFQSKHGGLVKRFKEVLGNSP